MEKLKSRAQRRHENARVRLSRRVQCRRDLSGDARSWGKAVATPAACSCWMCGNPRKYFGRRTIQELRALQAAHESE